MEVYAAAAYNNAIAGAHLIIRFQVSFSDRLAIWAEDLIDAVVTGSRTKNPDTLAVKSGNAVVHHKVVYVPENTVIHTQTNPTCTWIFIGGRWIQICT